MKPKGLRVITEELEKDVTFLVDVDPLFVSLVAHGANQQPFRVIKEESEKGGIGSGHPRHDGRPMEKGGSKPYDGSNDWMKHGGSVGMKDRIINIGKGGEGMSMIIQSILLPKGMSFDMLTAQKGLEFLADASQEGKKEFDRYTKFEQMPVEKFDKDSLTLTKIHDNGVWVVGGKLIDEKGAENALTLGTVKKQMDMEPNVMNTPIAQIEGVPIEVTFGQVFSQELSALVGTIQGILSQSGRDATTRKGDVLNALDAFGAFLSMSLDSLGEKAVKFNEKINESKIVTEGGEEEMFKTKEEFVAAVQDVVKGAVDGLVVELDKKFQLKQVESEEDKKKRLAEEEKKRLEEEGKKTDIGKLSSAIEEITKQVKTLAEKTEKIGQGIVTEPTVTVVEDPAKKKDEKPSPFKGIFSKRISQQPQS